MQAPNDAPFQTMDQVNDYLSGHTVECLICGKRYQCLNSHIIKMHDTSADDYRRRFGIPFARSLTSARFRAVGAANVTTQAIEGLRRAVASRTEPINLGPHKKGIPAVINLFKGIRERTGCLERAQAPATVSCVDCGADVVTTVAHASLRLRCLKCTTPALRRGRLTYWRNKWKTIPPPLTPSELAKFDKPFQTMEEVDAYLSGETVACLICGQHKSSLGRHLSAAHKITPVEYRHRFGIPLTRGLLGAPLRAAFAAAMTGERLEWFKGVSAGMKQRGLHKTANPRGASAMTAPCVRNKMLKIYERGRLAFARKQVTVACPKCGVDVITTALHATKPVHCLDCATPASRHSRLRKMREKQAA